MLPKQPTKSKESLLPLFHFGGQHYHYRQLRNCGQSGPHEYLPVLNSLFQKEVAALALVQKQLHKVFGLSEKNVNC